MNDQRCCNLTNLDIFGIPFAWAQWNIVCQLGKLNLSQNWIEVFKERWGKNLVIEKPSVIELILARISFPNIPFNWEFSNFVKNYKKCFM
jgi:hypothetical protein